MTGSSSDARLITPTMLGAWLVLATVPLWINTIGLYPYIGVEILIWAIYALAFNLVLGTSGLPSFGHGAFFGVGAYAFASYLATFANYVSTYAGLASIMIALVFLYIVGVIFIIGAEINAALLKYRVKHMILDRIRGKPAEGSEEISMEDEAIAREQGAKAGR